MGKSTTLVYQIGRYYKLKYKGIYVYFQVIKTADYKKNNGLMGQRVTFQLPDRPEITIEREQQYR